MDVSTMSELISTIGFPIAVCLICFWYINKKDSENKEAVEKMTEAIQNNTMVVQRLLDRLTDRNDFDGVK